MLTKEENYLALIAGDSRGVSGIQPETVREEMLDKISKTGGMLPAGSSEAEGKVPTVGSDGKYSLEFPPSELPAVTADDNGKVLTVVDGVWAVASLPANDTQQSTET